MGTKDDLQEVLDGVEEDYVDPLKDKIEDVMEKPLGFMKEYGVYVVFGFIGVVALIGLMALLI